MFLKEEEEEKGEMRRKIKWRCFSANQGARKEQKKYKLKTSVEVWGVTFKEKESGRHRLTRGSEKTAQGGRCGRSGTRPLRLEQQVQSENATQKPLCTGPNWSRGFRARPFTAPSWHWAVRAAPHLPAALASSCSITAPLHSPSANMVSWELPDAPMSPPRPRCCSSLLGRKVFFGDCWTASKIQLNNPARKAVFSPIFQTRKLRLDEFSRPSC